MKLQNFTETFWKSIKFFLLFVLSTMVLFILLTKFLMKVPIADNQKLLAAITEFEEVIENEKETASTIKLISEEIKIMEFDVYQVQKQDEIKRQIFKVQSLYKKYDLNSKYKFSIHAKNILEIYYDTREKNSKLQYNIELLTKNLTECQANL